MGNFSWLRRDGAFSHIPGGPLLDLSFGAVVPLQVMAGFRPWEFHGRVHAGVVIGWVHKPAAFLIEKSSWPRQAGSDHLPRHGAGHAGGPGRHALLDGLMRLAAQD